MAVQGGPHLGSPGLLLSCECVGSAAQATPASPAARAPRTACGPQSPQAGRARGCVKQHGAAPGAFGVAGGRRQAPGPHLNWGLLTRVRRAAVKAATSPCSRAEPGPAMGCLRERGGGRRRRQAGRGCRMAGGELQAVGRPASPGRPRGGGEAGTAHCQGNLAGSAGAGGRAGGGAVGGSEGTVRREAQPCCRGGSVRHSPDGKPGPRLAASGIPCRVSWLGSGTPGTGAGGPSWWLCCGAKR